MSWLCGAASKETAIVFPLLVVLWRVVLGRHLTRAARERLQRAAVGLFATTIVLATIRLAVLLMVEHGSGVRFHWQLVLVDLDVIRQYVLLLVTPGGQSVFHAVESISSVLEPRAIGAVLFTAGLLGAAWIARRRLPIVGFGILWFLVSLGPIALLVTLDLAQPIAEHRTYMANTGMFMAAGVGLALLLAHVGRSATLVARNLVMAVVWLGPAAMAGQTVVRNAMWAQPRVLWLEAVQHAPDIWLPHLLLGEAMRADGLRTQAVGAFRNAVRLRPDNPDAYLKLAVCLAELGRLREAGQVFDDLRRQDPSSPIAPEGLGTVALLDGRRAEARAHFLEALRLDPGNVAARQSLAMLSEQDRRPDDAYRLCTEIQTIAPDTPGVAECIARNGRPPRPGALDTR
jgi:hypothetical protein